ncbi:transglycosylase SLT domain-containing protein [Muricoccus radiodurans]|uniref:transglycosylase SLT domain-containing protein n=1 Tax=Muricoccus radiodurans TaxID=2231721 RepID=UPI003CE7B14A
MSDPLTVAAFLGHLTACAAIYPVIAEVPTTRAVATAQAESRLHPFAIGDNATGRSYFFRTREEAVAKARELLALGHRIDAGPMQVTDRNWAAYGLTVETVFDPRDNICAGGRILGEAFAIERRAHCRYNTGRAACTNGYPARVDAAAARLPLPPPIAEVARPAPAPPPSPAVLAACGPEPAAWDGWALQAHEGCARRIAREPSPPSAGGSGAPSVVASSQPPEPR